MSYASGGGWTCDGCRGHMPLDGPTPMLSYPPDAKVPKHYHQRCWQTGWYGDGAPEGEWPTPEGKPPANLPRRDSEPTFDHIKGDRLWQIPDNVEVRTVSSTGGEKGVKPARFDLIPVGPLTTVAKLYGKGAEKYADHNWRRGYEWSKSYAALMRHATQFWNGEDLDPDTGLPHMASVVFHALALLEYMEQHPDFDDRHKRDNGNVSE